MCRRRSRRRLMGVSMTIRFRYWPLFCLLGLALAHPANAQDGKRGFYASLTGMNVIPRDSEVTDDADGVIMTADLTMESNVGILAAAGYRFGGGLRAEFEIGFRRSDLDQLEGVEFRVGGTTHGVPVPIDADGQVDVLSFMVNGVYDFDAGSFRPYVGAGIGLASLDGEIKSASGQVPGVILDSDDVAASDTGAAIAYQVLIGVGFPLSDNLGIFAGYRYFATSEAELDTTDMSYAAHNFEVGIRFSF